LGHLAQIDGAVDRLQGLVNQTISMLTAEKFDAVCHRKPHDLSALLHLAADDIRPFIALRRQQFHLNLPDDLGSASFDAGKIRDSLNHLLLNAVKFTPDGGLITLSASHTDTTIAIDVTDTGIGIAPECVPRLFEPFFTGFDVSRHSSGHYQHNARGLGLGLSVVRAFIEMHGGTVEVESEVGRGSKFTIRWPLNASPQSAPTDAPPSSTASSGGLDEFPPLVDSAKKAQW
ncbi:MAG TPA: HAMP domain-containing sensor histidine kinase, partial [Tepidisphaeraceae bacterium]|nr:HAMP domain-containing sensor histidine kinase [Tepidisphaeraceae bacterium]